MLWTAFSDALLKHECIHGHGHDRHHETPTFSQTSMIEACSIPTYRATSSLKEGQGFLRKALHFLLLTPVLYLHSCAETTFLLQPIHPYAATPQHASESYKLSPTIHLPQSYRWSFAGDEALSSEVEAGYREHPHPCHRDPTDESLQRGQPGGSLQRSPRRQTNAVVRGRPHGSSRQSSSRQMSAMHPEAWSTEQQRSELAPLQQKTATTKSQTRPVSRLRLIWCDEHGSLRIACS